MESAAEIQGDLHAANPPVRYKVDIAGVTPTWRRTKFEEEEDFLTEIVRKTYEKDSVGLY